MDTQLPMKIVFFVDSLFSLSLISQRIYSFRLNCLHSVFNIFLCTRYAMISQLSMRSVSILYSKVLLAHVIQWKPSFQRKLIFLWIHFFVGTC